MLADSYVHTQNLHGLSGLALGLPTLQASRNTLHPCPPTYAQKPPSLHWAYPPSPSPLPASLSLTLPQHPSPGGGLAPQGSLPRTAPPRPQGSPSLAKAPLHSWPEPLLRACLTTSSLHQSVPPSWEEDHRAWPLQAGLPESSNHGAMGLEQTWQSGLRTLVTEMQGWGGPSLLLTRLCP